MIRFLTGVMMAVGAGARAPATLERAYAGRLMRARGAAAVARVRREYDHARVTRLRCEVQERQGLAPLACYEVLDLERAWSIGTPDLRLARRRRLDAACVRAADRLRVPATGDIPRAVTDACRRRAREAMETNRYRASTWSTD